MYDDDAVVKFGSAETKLKQLHIKLKEAETAQNKMKQESENLRRNISRLSNHVPDQMASKIRDFLLKMAGEAMDNMDEHLDIRQKQKMPQISAIDQQGLFQENLRGCLELINRGEEYYRFMHMRTLKEKGKKQTVNKK